jgi:hypothetical protein
MIRVCTDVLRDSGRDDRDMSSIPPGCGSCGTERRSTTTEHRQDRTALDHIRTRRGALITAGLAIFAVVTGCGGQPDRADSGLHDDVSSSTENSPATVEPSQAPIVGEWQRTQKCAELVGLLRTAGMEQWVLPMLAEDGWIPGVTKPAQIDDPTQPCQHAVPRKHSHFFTAAGEFGSRDAAGQQVDDGSYELKGSHQVVIGDVTFRYRITGNDTIAFTPVPPDCRPGCFDAPWSVSVAYRGYTWHRVG